MIHFQWEHFKRSKPNVFRVLGGILLLMAFFLFVFPELLAYMVASFLLFLGTFVIIYPWVDFNKFRNQFYDWRMKRSQRYRPF